MKATRDEKNVALYEYAFWDLIDDHNAGNKNDKDNIIRVSEARKLRSDVTNYLASKDLTFASANVGQFKDACNQVLNGVLDEPAYDESQPTRFKEQMGDFVAMTGFGQNARGEVYMPVSPYDERFAEREGIKRNGSQLSAVQVSDVAELNDMLATRETAIYTVKQTNKGPRFNRTNDKLTSNLDIMGLTPLMKHMKEDEFDMVSSWVGSTMSDADLNPEVMATRQSMAASGVTILKGLSEMGVQYRLVPDTKQGQVKAVLDGTHINVRIIDTPENKNYVGRVYDNGLTVFYSSTRKATKESGGTTYARHEQTPEQSLDLVKFAMGERTYRQDKPNMLVGAPDTFIRQIKRDVRKEFNAAYHTADTFGVVVGDYMEPATGQKDPFGNKVLIRTQSKHRSASTTYFGSNEDAENYLKTSIASARVNFQEALDVERLIDESIDNALDETYVPQFSGDTAIATYQQAYWDVLTGKSDTLLRPSASAEEYEERLLEIGDVAMSTPEAIETHNQKMAELTYPMSMSVVDTIRAHSEDLVDYQIGTYDVDIEGKRFNPVGVSTHQTSAYGVFRNNDDIVSALRMTGIPGDELKGNDFYNATVKTRLVKFNERTATVMKDSDNPFVQSMYEEIRDSLTSNGLIVDDKQILLDENGIVRYSARMYNKQASVSDDLMNVRGEIGQIFVPDEHGILETKFAGGNNYACVPGYEADILPQKDGERKSVEERTKLRGYEQIMKQAIRYQIRQDCLSPKAEVGAPTNVNNVYSRLYSTRYDLDFIDQYREQGMSDDMLMAIIETQAARVRYSNEVRDGSTINADYRANAVGLDMANDNFNDTYILTGGRNMSILTEHGDGYFDPVATTSTSTNQGTLRFLAKGSKVTPDGFIIPGEKGDQCAIMAHELSQYASFDPFDRQCMTLSNIMQASAITEKPVNVAQMTFGGWNFDDPVIVSKAFSEQYQMRNHDGDMRPLIIGDKVSDLHGNKGVISLIIDPEMSLEEAEAKGISEQVKWFKANPELDMVTAPFSAASRFNGGTAREMMANPKDLVAPDGTIHEASMGSLKMIITDKAADTKTHIYDDTDIAQGKGRKVSAQLAWALNSKDCSAIMNECYGGNGGATTNLRETLIAVGLDMDESGTLRVGYEPHGEEKRNVFEMPELKYNAKGGLNMKSMREDFGKDIANKGGVLEIPFQLQYPTGEDIPQLNDGKTDVIYKTQEWERAGYHRKDGTWVKPTTVTRKSPSKQVQVANPTYGLPVMSSYLRSGQSFADGTSSVHDYTNHYLTVFEEGIKFKDAEERLKDKSLDDKTRAKYEAVLTEAPARAQLAYNRITNDVQSRAFAGKHNMFRDDLMSKNMPRSATSIWSADPRLNIDEVAVGQGMAESLNIQNNDYVMIWRDPVLRDGGVRYMKCVIDPELTGIAINPVMDKSFDGDFDGDTVGVLALQTEAAKKEAMAKLSIGANLLDKGSRDKNGLFSLNMQDSLDVKVAMHKDASLKQRWDDMTVRVNEMEASGQATNEARQEVINEMSDFYQDVFKGTVGDGITSYKDVGSHVESIWDACIETGAKGSPAKIKSYMHYLGVEGQWDADGKCDFANLKDYGHTLATRSESQGVQTATAVKSFGTGVAGKFSQRGICNLRNVCPTSVLELTYPVTQSILQAKHDPIDAKHKYDVLMGTARQLWKGHLMEPNDNTGGWKVVRDAERKPVQATTEQWKAQFMDIYTSSQGLNVKITEENVNTVANAMSKDGVMLNIEDDALEVGAKSFMDKMAYEGDFAMLCEGAKRGENIFAGKYNSQFAPRVITQNARIMAQQQEVAVEQDKPVPTKKVKAITKSDAVNLSARKVKTESVAVRSTTRRTIDISSIEQAFDSGEYDNY